MTDVLSRPPVEAGGTAPLVLAVLSAGVGAIHLAMAPARGAASAIEGAALLAAGWAQVGLAVELARAGAPRRRALAATAGLNATLLAAWAAGRTVGLSVGAHPGRARPVSGVDALAVVFEAALVAGAAVLLWRPRTATRTSALAALAVSAAVIALTTAVVASPGARGHAGAVPARHDAAAPADDRGFSLLMNGHRHAMGPTCGSTPPPGRASTASWP